MSNSNNKAVHLSKMLSDKDLSGAWAITESEPVATAEVAQIRGWLMDEIEARLGADLFDQWLTANTPEPSSYLAQRAAESQPQG